VRPGELAERLVLINREFVANANVALERRRLRKRRMQGAERTAGRICRGTELRQIDRLALLSRAIFTSGNWNLVKHSHQHVAPLPKVLEADLVSFRGL
jgi:hypothetical protein